jgi:hypothetical protein
LVIDKSLKSPHIASGIVLICRSFIATGFRSSALLGRGAGLLNTDVLDERAAASWTTEEEVGTFIRKLVYSASQSSAPHCASLTPRIACFFILGAVSGMELCLITGGYTLYECIQIELKESLSQIRVSLNKFAMCRRSLRKKIQ